MTSDLPEIPAQKLIHAGQTLLTLIGEIKRNALVSDFAARNADAAAQREQYEAQQVASEAELLRITTRIAAVTRVCNQGPMRAFDAGQECWPIWRCSI